MHVGNEGCSVDSDPDYGYRIVLTSNAPIYATMNGCGMCRILLEEMIMQIFQGLIKFS